MIPVLLILALLYMC